MFQQIHDSFDDIDSEKMYPFYVEKEPNLDLGENCIDRLQGLPYPHLNNYT